MAETTKGWTTQINEITGLYQGAFADLTPEQINWKPNPAKWSIGQVIDHVITLNETYYPIVEQLKAGTYRKHWLSRLPFLVRWFGKFILDGVEPQRKRKMKTFPLWEPAQSNVPGDIVARFAEHQKQLGKMMADCSPFVLSGAVISSPANRNIVYKLGTAFDIILAHERRHLNQALEVLEWMKNKG